MWPKIILYIFEQGEISIANITTVVVCTRCFHNIIHDTSRLGIQTISDEGPLIVYHHRSSIGYKCDEICIVICLTIVIKLIN